MRISSILSPAGTTPSHRPELQLPQETARFLQRRKDFPQCAGSIVPSAEPRSALRPNRCCKSSSALCRLQRIHAKLRVIGFIAPAMTVLGPVIDKQKNTRHRETFYQAIEKCLRFAVDPMQVLKDNQQRLPLSSHGSAPALPRRRVRRRRCWGSIARYRSVALDNVFEFRQCRRRMNFVGQRPKQ